MDDIKTTVVHSETKDAWNVVGIELGKKHKIARVPYFANCNCDIINTRNKAEALEHAMFISNCFDNASKLKKKGGGKSQ